MFELGVEVFGVGLVESELKDIQSFLERNPSEMGAWIYYEKLVGG